MRISRENLKLNLNTGYSGLVNLASWQGTY